jgi:acid-sensing ion channel, other
MNFLQALILFLSRIWHSFFRRLSSDFWGSETYSLKFPGKKRLIIPPDIYPLESSAKPDSGLKIVLARNQMVRRVDLCTALSFVVHSPFELPGSYGSTDTCDFHFGQDLDILIKPEIIKTDESFRSIDPQKRGCYFQGEKPLNFFQVYTRRNCEFECLADLLILRDTVNCTQFFMVRNDSIEVCDHRQENYAQYFTFFSLRKIARGETNCNCLDACDSIKYSVEVLSHNLNEYNDTLDRYQVDVEASLHFKLKDVDVVPLRRYQPFTLSDFLAQSGGMMGLFAGISALSIIEIFYFLTLRWMVNLRRWVVNR